MSKFPLALCDECTLQSEKSCKSYFPRIYQYKAMFVGQAAGSNETYTNVPFSGPAGKTHWSILKSMGLAKDQFCHTNACQCFPPGDRKPTYHEMMCCFPRLKEEILTVKPKLIIALGDTAMWTLTGLSGNITSYRGRIERLKTEYEWDCPVLICFHPSFVMRSRQWIPIQAVTYNKIHEFFQKGFKATIEPTLLLDPTEEELMEYLDTQEVVACDTETTGLNTRKDQIIGISFSKNSETAMALAFTGPDDPRWEIVKTFLEDPSKPKVWQFGSYDTSIIRYSDKNPFKIEDKGMVFDTKMAEQLLNSDLPADLDYLRSKYTQIPPYKPNKVTGEKYLPHTWGKEKMLTLAAKDAVTTLIVYQEQNKQLTQQEKRLMEDHLIPLIYAVGRMEARGVLVDIQTLAAMYSQCAPLLAEMDTKFFALGLNPRSPKQVKELLGLKDANKDTLKYHIKRDHPQAKLMEELLEYRHLDKMASVYLKGVYDRLEDGRIHTHFKIDGTGTGRLASEDPNLQNIPEEMRVIYVPEEEHIFLKGDYSQIELWVGAIIAKEDSMLQALIDGVDIHYLSCQLCFPHVLLKTGTRKGDFSHREGLIAKTVTFGTFYGRSPYSIAREFGVTVREAEEWQMKILNKYPKLREYKEQCDFLTKTKGYLVTPFGRKRYITSERQGYNFPIQSTASDITLGSIRKADALGLEPVISVHDDIVFQVKEKEYKKQLKLIRSVMERKVPELNNLSFKVEYQKGKNWYDLETIVL